MCPILGMCMPKRDMAVRPISKLLSNTCVKTRDFSCNCGMTCLCGQWGIISNGVIHGIFGFSTCTYLLWVSCPPCNFTITVALYIIVINCVQPLIRATVILTVLLALWLPMKILTLIHYLLLWHKFFVDTTRILVYEKFAAWLNEEDWKTGKDQTILHFIWQ